MRKYLAEFLGTFAMVFAGTGAVVIDSVTRGGVTHAGIALTFGYVFYLESALPSQLHDRFERHIAHCLGCQTYLEQMRVTIRVTGSLTPESLSPEAERALLDAFRGWKH